MSDIVNFDIRTHIIDSIVDVFDTMVSMAVEFSDSEPPDTTDSGRMVATVNFAGNVVGIINIQVAFEMSRLMMASMLEIEPEEVEDDGEIKDLLAEINNIVGGNLKSALNDAGHRCVISTPSITYGSDFTIKSLKMERFERFIFTHQENFILVEVGLKAQQASSDGDELGSTDALAQLSNADIAKINALDINARVSEAIIDVFDTMLSLKLEPVDAVTAESLAGIRNVGSVSFAGDATGMVSIHAGDSFSREMAAEMLGMEVEEIEGDEEIRDMLGEMGNIVGGNLKSAFTDAGLMCALSTPSFTSGTDFKIEALNMENYERFAFRCGKNIIFVEMGVKVSELVQADPRQGKDIHYAVGDDTTPEDAPAPSPEAKEEVSATSASDPAIPEQPDVSVKPDGVQAAEQEQPQVSAKPDEHKAAEQEQPQVPVKPDEHKAAEPEQPQIPVKPDEHKAAEQEQPQVSAKPDEHKAAEPEQSTVHPAEKGPAEIQDSKIPEDFDLDLLFDIPLEIKVELGRVRIKIQKLLNLAPGSALKLIKLEGDPVDILVNDTLIARGEVVVQNEKYGIRVTEITSRMDRIRSFGI